MLPLKKKPLQAIDIGIKLLMGYHKYQSSFSPIVLDPRPATLFVKNLKIDHPLTAVEIGVAGGFNAQANLKLLNLRKYYLVDPLTPYVDQVGKPSDFSGCVNKLKKLERKYKSVVFLRQTSKEAAVVIQEPLDFVYLDGNHEYEYVLEDIDLWWPKVAPGGVLAGHDFTAGCPGTIRAVVERFGWNFHSQGWDWWVQKPKA